jgi:hypothetical protein
MTEQQEAAPNAASAAGGERQRSTISFPYGDLASAIQLAKAIFDNVAGGECDDDQLAAWSNQSAKSSGFRTQVYGARTFGVLAGESSRHRVTELGKAIIDPHQEREAKVRAFLSVPLYSALFEKFKGGVLPPAAALEREIEALGVAPKQKDRARQVFERSAEQAGFFEHGRNRLVQPGISAGAKPPADENGGGGGGGGGDDSGITGNSVLDALLGALPKSGTDWPADDRVDWLKMVSMAMGMAYGKAETITITKAPPAPNAPPPPPPPLPS